MAGDFPVRYVSHNQVVMVPHPHEFDETWFLLTPATK
jgi:hypothetical protein